MTDSTVTPVHLGMILDGNRRWAKDHGLPTLEGHRKGADNLHDIAVAAFDRGVDYVSAYVFSTENWSRTEKEVSYLMGMVTRYLEKYLDEFNDRGIRVVILGRKEGLRRKVLNALTKSEEATANNTKGTLAFCFNYGGRDEIVDATKQLIAAGKTADEITPEMFEQALYHPEIPSIDLLVRTSGEHRLSGFMLWRASYAELMFTDKHWPDFTEADLDKVLIEFGNRKRRFGK